MDLSTIEEQLDQILVLLESFEYSAQLIATILLFLLACLAGVSVCLILYKFIRLFH